MTRSLEDIIASDPRFANVDINKVKDYYNEVNRSRNAKTLPELVVTTKSNKQKKKELEDIQAREDINILFDSNLSLNDRLEYYNYMTVRDSDKIATRNKEITDKIIDYKNNILSSNSEKNYINKENLKGIDTQINKSTFNGRNILEEGINPALNFISPSQQFGAIVDAIQGEVPYWQGIKNGNSGFVTDKFAKEHPYYSIAINGVGDAITSSLGKNIVTNFNRTQRLEKNYNKLLEEANKKGLIKDGGSKGYLTEKALYNLADAETFSINPFDWRNSVGNHLRYYKGKLGKFKNAELPNFIRKVRYEDTPIFAKTKDGKYAISSSDHRFLKENNTITPWTNLTIDNPVLPHKINWDKGYTIIGNFKNLLNKRVLSTTPGDVVINGDIALNKHNLKFITGNPEYERQLLKEGITPISSDELKIAFKKGKQSIGLTKEDYSDYASSVRKITRGNFKSPTLEDMNFMDYVFKPIIEHNSIPKINIESLKNAHINPNIIPDILRNVKTNKQLNQILNDNLWKNIHYYPAPYSDDQIRKLLNINILPPSHIQTELFTPINKNFVINTKMPNLKDINKVYFSPNIISNINKVYNEHK